MTLVEFLLLIVVAGVCGATGQAIAGFSAGGCFASVAVGFIGALLGVWIAGKLGLPEIFVVRLGEVSFPIIWSIAGSALFVALISLLVAFPRRNLPS